MRRTQEMAVVQVEHDIKLAAEELHTIVVQALSGRIYFQCRFLVADFCVFRQPHFRKTATTQQFDQPVTVVK